MYPLAASGFMGYASGMLRLLLACLLLGAAVPVSAEPHWRLRARQQYERGKINLADGQGDLGHRGFAYVIDFFREDPLRLLYGLTVHRGRLEQVDSWQSVNVTSLGAEVKHFPLAKKPFFWRGGLLATEIDPTDESPGFWTYGALAGVGAELPLGRLGIAPEIGGRLTRGTAGKRLTDFYVALGVHFYIFRGDAASRAANR